METRETLWIKPTTILSILTCSQCLENDGHLRQTVQENMSVVLAAFRNLKAGYNATVNAHDHQVDDVEELDVEIAQLEATLSYPQGEMEHLQEIIQQSTLTSSADQVGNRNGQSTLELSTGLVSIGSATTGAAVTAAVPTLLLPAPSGQTGIIAEAPLKCMSISDPAILNDDKDHNIDH